MIDWCNYAADIRGCSIGDANLLSRSVWRALSNSVVRFYYCLYPLREKD